MSFSIQLASDLVALEPGVNTPLTVQVANRREESDRYEVEVEGLDPEWTAVPVPLFTVGAGETSNEKVFFNPPRSSESLAGNYPFVVKVRSINSGDSRTAQGVLQIKPYNNVSMDLVPKKGVVSPLRAEEVFHATIMNLGNAELTLSIFGNDPEDAFVFEIEQSQVTIGPGQQKEVEVVAKPASTRPFASPRLYLFTVSARGVNNASVQCSAQAQIEQRPLVTPGVLLIFAFLALLFFGWYRFRPVPPSMALLTVDPPQAEVGQTFTIKWKAENAKSVNLTINDTDLAVEPEGTRTFPARQSGTVEAEAVGEHSERSKPIVMAYTVTQPPVVPKPKIVVFDVSPHEVPMGQSFLVKYSVQDATKVTLVPANLVLDPNVSSVQLKADEAGTFKYTLVAENSKGDVARSKEVKVRVVQTSQTNIVFFDVQPRELTELGGKVKVSWQLSDAAKAQLLVNGAPNDVPTTGETEMDVSKTAEFVLVGYDSKGLTKRSQKITVKVKPPPTPPSEPTTATTTAGTGQFPATTTTTGSTATTGGR